MTTRTSRSSCRRADSAGATATKSVVAQTEEHNLSVSSTPAGASVVVNATNSVANPVLKEVAGSQNRLIARPPRGASSSCSGPTA